MNEHLKKYLEWYLDDKCVNPKFALLLKGGWGSGKTYFIKHFIEKQELIWENNSSSDKGFLYISLYGLSSTTDIDDQIFQQLHPILASKGVAIAGKIAKGLIKLGLKINLDDDGGVECNANSEIPSVSLKPFLNKFKNRILVFDDLERCNILIELLLGYINSYVEHQDKKVILVSNDDEIESTLDTKDISSNSKYHKIKEKVIGKIFTIATDNSEVITSLINDCSDSSKEFLLIKKDICIEIFNSIEKETGHRNFRAFGHALRNFEFIWHLLDDKLQNHDDLMSSFLNYYIRLNYELQLGNIIENDLQEINIEKYNLSRINIYSQTKLKDQEESTPSLDRLNVFFTRNSIFNSYNPLIPYSLWYKILCQNGDYKDELNEALSNTEYFIDENTPEWKKLWYQSRLDDDKIEEIIIQVSENIDTHQYTHPGVVLHVFSIFMYLSDLGYVFGLHP